MTKYVIEKGIIIDDVESVLHQVREMSSKVITNIEVIKKFILREKNTRFYLDANLNSYMQPISNCIYLWVDTGYVDVFGNPILISLLKKDGIFQGHVVGTLKQLCHNAQRFFCINKVVTNKKIEIIRKNMKQRLMKELLGTLRRKTNIY